MSRWIILAAIVLACAAIWHVKPWRARTTRIVTNDAGTCSVHERHWPWLDRAAMDHYRANCLRCAWHQDSHTMSSAQYWAKRHECEETKGWTG